MIMKKRLLFKFILIVFIIGVLQTCKEDEKVFNEPVITTVEITEISSSTAVSGGNITDDGGAEITACGVCWNTTGNPTIENNFTVDVIKEDAFISNIGNLEDLQIYYVRAYATNLAGTSYGDELTFTTLGSVKDYDGNIYKAVQIGEQVWMAEDLKTTHYADGTPLVDGTEIGVVSGDYETKYYYSYERADIGIEGYGRLYTWAAAMNGEVSSFSVPSEVQGVCPDGWHVPSKSEWTVLLDYLGGYEIAGKKLKSTDGWIENGDGNNTSGFNALPTGVFVLYQGYGNQGAYSYYWSSSELNELTAFRQELSYLFDSMPWNTEMKNNGFSVRCVKD